MRRVIGFLIFGVNAVAIAYWLTEAGDGFGEFFALHYLWLGAMGVLLTSWVAAGPDRECPACGRPWERGLTGCPSCNYYHPGPFIDRSAPLPTPPAHRTATPGPPAAPRRPVPPPPPPGARP